MQRGFQFRYLGGQRHREDGPAVEYADGRREWCMDGRFISFAEWVSAVCSSEEERVALVLRWS